MIKVLKIRPKAGTEQAGKELKQKCHELTGKWIPFHLDCLRDFGEYKEYMQKIIKEYEKDW